MTFTVRELDLSSQGPQIAELLRRHFDGWKDGTAAKFDWLYRKNPFGPARVWGLSTEREDLAGISAAFPRKLRTPEGALDVWVLGDFCVAPEERSLGPAIALQKAACAGVDRGEAALWYDFPSRTMLAVYGRMGLRAAGEMVRMAFPLRVDRILEKKLGSPMLARGLGAVASVVLRARSGSRDRGVEPVLREVAFEGFLGAGLEAEGGLYLERSAAYVNWRYREDPRTPVSFLSVSDEAHLAFRAEEDSVLILDVFGARAQSLLRALVLEVIAIGRERSAENISLGISDQHPWMGAFEELGFRRREGAPFVAYAAGGPVGPLTPWFLMNGDRDQ